MSLDWIWPRISDKTSARKAIKEGSVACIIIAAIDGAIGVYALAANRTFAGYDALILVDATVFAIVAWRLWKNSRPWSVVALLLMSLEVAEKLHSRPNTFSIVTVILFVAIFNATRATFALHRYNEREKLSPVLAESNKPLG
jgi:hypothetical protein